MLTFGSLFAGIGGLDLGLERAGMRCLWQVEIDDYANRVLSKHWPDVARYRDVRECGKHNLAPVDLVCGGFPCQDVSLAGKRAGLEGKRSTLWGEFARIVGELRPQWVLAENVPGLRSSDNGRFFGNVLRDLAACGYDAEWDCIPAAAVGAPHRRDRIFIVAYPNGRERGRRVFAQREPQGRDADAARDGAQRAVADAPRIYGKRAVAGGDRCGEPEGEIGNGGCVVPHATGAGLEGQVAAGRYAGESGLSAECDWWATEPNVGRVANGVPARVDRLRCLGNAVVPQVAEWIGRRIASSVL